MSSEDLADLSATELLTLFAAGEAGPVEAVQACLARIDRLDPELNAVRTLLGEAALTAAAESAQRWARGAARPLEGVPFALKDIISTAGVPTSGGSGLYVDWLPTETAAHAQRLQDAGAVLLAKLNTFEFAGGGAYSRHFGAVRNPWDTRRTTGGSSTGSGAAVGARLVPLAVGTDTGGSVRVPAAYCGITGLKPTNGRVPRHGVMGLSWTLDHVGPMTRTAGDAALALGVMAGSDPRDPGSSVRPVPDYVAALDGDVRGQRVGRLRGYVEEQLQPGVRGAYESAMAELADLGVEIVDVELPGIAEARTAGWLVCYAETLALHREHFGTLEDRDEMIALTYAAGPFVSAADYLQALRYRAVFQQSIEAAMAGCSALVLPTTDTVAPLLRDTGDAPSLAATEAGGEADWMADVTRNNMPFSFAGVPGLSVPCGFDGGMPVGMQMLGRPHDDAGLLRLAAAYQRTTVHHLVRPGVLDAVPA
jgi:aspartyl-tRNA(Asn)/glutamyl-tRNA(Gln) amidotransferase subunit A